MTLFQLKNILQKYLMSPTIENIDILEIVCNIRVMHITYSVTGSSGLEGGMESDTAVAVRHREVPGDLTRSSTYNKINRNM